MKVERLKIHNLKRISDLDLVPAGSLVVVSGKNGAGKTTVLDSIMIAIGGAKHIPVKPVKRGEDKALIEVDLGDLNVKRTITPDGGGTLIVRNKDGVRQESPQGILDELFGMLTFDPQSFRNANAHKRYEMLSQLLGLDFDKVDAEIKEVYDDRTLVNREVKSAEARVQSVTEFPDAPKAEISTADVSAEQMKAYEHNKANGIKRANVTQAKGDAYLATNAAERAKKECSETRAQIERLKALEEKQITEFDRLTSVAEEALKLFKAREKEAATLVDIDVTSLAKRLDEVNEINRKVRSNLVKEDLRTQLKAKTKEAEDLTSQIEKLEKKKREQISAAKYPVEGLSLSDTRDVLFNGIPFDQASTGEQIRVSVAMGLAMNSKLNILLIRQGNDLDVDNLKLVAEMAEKAGAQVWIERVSSEGGAQVILEEGAATIAKTGGEQKELV